MFALSSLSRSQLKKKESDKNNAHDSNFKIIALPTLQEIGTEPANTGSDIDVLEKEFNQNENGYGTYVCV